MNAPVAARRGALAAARAAVKPLTGLNPLATNGLFYLYLSFVVVHFLRFSARIPGIGVLRPTLLMVGWIAVALFIKRPQLVGRLDNEPNRRLQLFVLWVVLTLPFVEWPGSVLRNNLEEWIRVAVFFYFTVLIVDSYERLRLFVAVFIGTQIVRVLEPLYLHVTTGYWGSNTYIGAGEFMARLAGGPYDIVNPNGLAFVIVSVIPFVHYMWFSSPRAGFFSKLIAAGVQAAMLYALVLTSSRSGMLALLAIIIGIFLKSNKKALFVVVVGVVGTIAFANMSPLQRDRYLSIVSSDTRGAATAEGRISGLQQEMELGLRKPIFGHGLGTSGEAKFHYLGNSQIAHDLYTELVICNGVPGLILFMAFLWAALRSARDLRANVAAAVSVSPEQKNYLQGLSDAIQVWAAMCFFISLAYFGLLEWHWYLMAGICTAAARVAAGLQARGVGSP
jgi:putative inorganic carbon (HCO3(-)) transporter